MAVKRERAELIYPHGVFDPLDWLCFLELRPFSRRRSELGLDDEFLRALQIGIMLAPKRAPVISGTGGLRKLRFHRPGGNKGKSGGLRVCYVFFEVSGIVALVTVYAKGECDDISPAQKTAFKKLIEEIERGLSERGRTP
jgi:hypothetical protein